jgi:hypothetical protein
MSLRRLPTSERAFATLVVLALALALGLGLASVYTRELRPAGPSQALPVRSRLVAVLEGVMAVNVTPAETDRFKTWVASGATREGFVQVEAVVVNTCASCHAPGGQFPHLASYEDLRPLAQEAAPEGLLASISARSLHLVVLPVIFLVALGGYLRRTTEPRRRFLMGAGALAVMFDAVQWSLRQGRPEALWAAWTAATALALTMAAVVGMVLAELWGPTVEP